MGGPKQLQENFNHFVGSVRLIPEHPPLQMPPIKPLHSSNKIVPKFQREIFGPMVLNVESKGHAYPAHVSAPEPEAPLLEKTIDEEVDPNPLASACPDMLRMLETV